MQNKEHVTKSAQARLDALQRSTSDAVFASRRLSVDAIDGHRMQQMRKLVSDINQQFHEFNAYMNVAHTGEAP